MKDLEVAPGCTAVALHIAGRRNSVADALSRPAIRVCGLDPRPRRDLRPEYRRGVIGRCGAIDVELPTRDDGPDAWEPEFRSPSNSAFEGPLPAGQLWRFPRVDMVDLALTRAAPSLKEDWSGPQREDVVG